MKKLFTILAVLALALIGLDTRLAVRHYVVDAEQVTAPIHLAVLSDYHGCDYGPGGEQLVKAVTDLAPDLILMLGDMFSADGDPADELAMFHALTGIADVYYVSGNHEYWEHDMPALLDAIGQTGVTVLHAASTELELHGSRITLCGVPDPTAGQRTHINVANAAANVDPEAFAILMAHRPESVDKYAAAGVFDLVLCGHAHGGQVRIPGLLNGLYAPDQGWFPPHAGGQFDLDSLTLIVSRGLSTYPEMGVPRFFNRPELLLVEIQ